MPVPKKRIPFSQNDIESIDERICSPSNHSNQPNQFRGVKKSAFEMVKEGTNLLDLPAGVVNSTVEDAQFLYSTQIFNDVLMKSLSTTQVPDAYDNLNAQLREDDKQEILKDEEFRRAIHSRSTAWNSLGMYRSDFNKTDNDKMARNAYVAMVEKAFLDYIGSVGWDVIDRLTGDRVDYAYDFMYAPNPQDSFRDVFVPSIRDLFRYDAGAIVKTFNRRMELTELRPYLGTEFWIEFDRVPQVISVPANDNSMGIRATDYHRGTGTVGNEIIMQGWWSRGYTWRYWQRSQTGVYVPFTPSEICYLTLYRQSDDVYGTDYIKFLKYWIQYLIDSTVAAGKTFQNGMIPSLILNHPNIYDINQIQQRLTQLRFENQGPTRTGTVMHLVNGESAQTLAQKLHDMEWVEGQKFVAQLVWGYFGFPSDEFIGGDSNRAVAYVHRNVTKSRLLKPMMKYLEDKINREILPFLKGYKKSWEFRFIQEMELDDKQKVAQTGAIRMGSISAGLGAGMPARLAYKIANDEPLSKADLEELDEAKQNAMMQEMGGMMGDEGNQDILGDQEQGRYGQGSEMYQPVNVSDYGQGGENTEQRMGNKEEVEYQKSELQYEVGSVFHKAGKRYEIISNNGEFAKARIYVADVKDVPKGRSYKMGTRGGIYYIGTLAEKQQGEGNKRTPHGAVEAQPKNGNGGGNGANRAPASAASGQQGKPQIPEQPHDMPFTDEGNQKLAEFYENKLKGEVSEYGEKHCDPHSEIIAAHAYKANLKVYSRYLGSFYSSMNPLLRDGKLSSSPEFVKKIETYNQELHTVIEKAPKIPEGITLWRGVPKDLKLEIGYVYEDKGFQSHTLEPKRAAGFSKSSPKRTILRAITDGKAKGIYTNVMGEREVTIQNGTKWKVLDKRQVNKNVSVVTMVPA